MLPAPPPPTIPTYTEDWSNDTSFDLPSSPTRLILSTSQRAQSPPTPSTSSTRSRSSRGSDVHASSPLRQLVLPSPARSHGRSTSKHSGTTAERGEEDDDFLLEDEMERPLVLNSNMSQSNVKHTPSRGHAIHSSGSSSSRIRLSPSSSIGSSSSVIKNLTKTVTQAPGGIITRFSSAPKNKKLSPVSAKAKEKAVERAWERDFDFDDDGNDDAGQTLGQSGARFTPASRPSTSIPAAASKKGFIAMPSVSAPGPTHPKEESWDDLDGLAVGSGITIRMRKQPGPDALDELDDLDAFGDGFDEDEATLKAGATLRAQLPPSRAAKAAASSGGMPATSSAPMALCNTKGRTPAKAGVPDEDMETDFVLPLNLDSLTLVDQFNSRNTALASQAAKRSRPRTSTSTATSVVSADWDSPHPSHRTGTTVSSRKGFWGDDTDSPRGFSDSITSATSSLSIHTPKDKSRELWDGEDEEEDMEAGLVLPTNLFAGKGLQGVLEEKTRVREQEAKAAFAAQVAQYGLKPASPLGQRGIIGGTVRHRRDGTDETTRTENESIEDGLVFEDPGRELSKRQLERARKTRTPLTDPGAGKRTVSGGSANGSNGSSWGRTAAQKQKERAWEKEREQGWGRHTPLPRDVRDRKQSTIAGGLTPSMGAGWGNRSHSATVNTKESLRRADSPASFVPPNKPRTSMNAINMAPPPPPASTMVPTTPSRLRHQKSHAALPSTPSSGLSRKRSLPSLAESANPLSPVVAGQSQSAFVKGTVASTAAGAIGPERWYSSASRATGPTSSSLAKMRSTPGVQSIFNLTTTGSGSASGSYTPYTPTNRSAAGSGDRKGMSGVARYIAAGANARTYDGSELDSIDDLEVGAKSGSLRKRSDKSRGALRDVHIDPKGKSAKQFPSAASTPSSEHKSRSKADQATTKTGSLGRKRGVRAGVGLISAKGQQGLSWMQKHAEHADVHFNPDTGRWEGNDENKTYARIFDEDQSLDKPGRASSDLPARPALITPLGTISNPDSYTSSTTLASLRKSKGNAIPHPDPRQDLATIASAAMRVVGDMKFDPEKMCWVSNLDPEDEEPDPFEGWGDDEDEEKGGTIKVIKGKLGLIVGGGAGGGGVRGGGWGRMASESSSTGSFDDTPGGGGGGRMGRTISGVSVATTVSQFGSSVSTNPNPTYRADIDSRDSAGLADERISKELREECREAEKRHKREVRDWTLHTYTHASTGGHVGNGASGRNAEKEEKKEEAVRRAKEGAWQIRQLAFGVKDP